MTQTASNYPVQWETDVQLEDGDTVHLRPVQPEDGEGLEKCYQGVSQRSRRSRFLSAMPGLPAGYISRLTHVDYHDRVVLVAILLDEIVGVGEYVVAEPGVANTAVVVQDQHEGRGIGKLLMAHLAKIAHESGVDRFTAEVRVDNERMIQILWEQGDQVGHVEGELDRGIVYLKFGIDDLPSQLRAG